MKYVVWASAPVHSLTIHPPILLNQAGFIASDVGHTAMTQTSAAQFRNIAGLIALALATVAGISITANATPLTLAPKGSLGFDIVSGDRVIAPIRLSSNGLIVAAHVQREGAALVFTGLRCSDPAAIKFAGADYVRVEPAANTAGSPPSAQEWVVSFKLTLVAFDSTKWQAICAKAPFHFLTCSLPTATVWNQRGWLNATPVDDPFPLLGDVHGGSPEISSLWNRNWSYICPMGGSPIPMLGLWDTRNKLYVGYDFQDARAHDQSDRYISGAYCWSQGADKSFITLATPFGGHRYGELLFPQAGDIVSSHFNLIVDTDLPDTSDPNERFQERLFARYANNLAPAPAGNDLSWFPGSVRLSDFPRPPSLNLFGAGGETRYYEPKSTMMFGWGGQEEMPVDAALQSGDDNAINHARKQIDELLATYAQNVTIDGDDCLFWPQPLTGSWVKDMGGEAVKTIHETPGWFAARVIVELYRYDRGNGKADPRYAAAIDSLYNWAKHFVWTRNEFADVPSSPFAIGDTLPTAFLIDYYYTFKNDPTRSARAQQGLKLADNIVWRYSPIWAMDSDRYDDTIDGSFLLEPNSGRDWAGLACSNEVAWCIDTITQVYVSTGDPRLRYYLRGALQRWPLLYRPQYHAALAQYDHTSTTEGFGLFDGSGPGRGERYAYGGADGFPQEYPIGASKMRVVAGARGAIAFCKDGLKADIDDYRTDGNGHCSFRINAKTQASFDVSFSYPEVDVSAVEVSVNRGGADERLPESSIRRPQWAPSSLYLAGLHAGDIVTIGPLSPTTPILPEKLIAGQPIDKLSDVAQIAGFKAIPLSRDTALAKDWNDLGSFAGLIEGERWAFGIPYLQTDWAASQPVLIAPTAANDVFVAYSAPGDSLTSHLVPTLRLSNGRRAALSGNPIRVWQGWPPIFHRSILLDHARIPAGATLTGIDPNGALVMAASALTASAVARQAIVEHLQAPTEAYRKEAAAEESIRQRAKQFAAVPQGSIAIIPDDAGGAGSTYLQRTGLYDRSVALTRKQLIDPSQFNRSRFPMAIAVGGEDYVRSVETHGDARDAVVRYLHDGGTLVVLASSPFPFFYAQDFEHGKGKTVQSSRLLPDLGLPIGNAFETPPTGLVIKRADQGNIFKDIPGTMPYPTGDGRLRSVRRADLPPHAQYDPYFYVTGPDGQDYGDAACQIRFTTGPAASGTVIYVWSGLSASEDGNAILGDVLAYALKVSVQ